MLWFKTLVTHPLACDIKSMPGNASLGLQRARRLLHGPKSVHSSPRVPCDCINATGTNLFGPVRERNRLASFDIPRHSLQSLEHELLRTSYTHVSSFHIDPERLIESWEHVRTVALLKEQIPRHPSQIFFCARKSCYTVYHVRPCLLACSGSEKYPARVHSSKIQYMQYAGTTWIMWLFWRVLEYPV